MIKFFGHIREKLLSKNKISNYLLYAIGEIALVMIGILLALQVNNWNESRKLISLKDNYLERLINDVKNDTTTINYVVSEIEKNQISINTLIKTLNSESDHTALDSIITNFFRRGWIISEFTPSTITYTDLSQTGNMKILWNPELTEDIIEYYGYISDIEKSNITNKTWITPLDIAVAKLTSAFELDPNTRQLFSHKSKPEALKNIQDNHELIERNAAGHYWINTSLSDNLIALKSVSIQLLKTIHNERELIH
ncbi:hypothetical protein SAMN04515667_1060 [Formosa sp. Hel1_31_208]|uniref:DUF6090 family protein n=1 Tax=Formosa sp. Hel1_31_208 TaxID=1798225 RepID=UPI00087B3A86|nr:DUF6090 family protein [Formosa sp. Hel1_31_208]SDR94902.1 hypothetical protein SAMN04515667_1060 [Formosa sp. Hel1_31_208]